MLGKKIEIDREALGAKLKNACALDLDRARGIVDALKSVERRFKKDGGNYANLKQAFGVREGAPVSIFWKKGDWGELTLRLTWTYQQGGAEKHNSLYIQAYENVEDVDREQLGDRVCARCYGLKDFYHLNATEMAERIGEHLKRAEERVAKREANIDRAVEVGLGLAEKLGEADALVDVLLYEVELYSPIVDALKSERVGKYL